MKKLSCFKEVTLSPESKEKVAVALRMVEESRPRMNSYTKEQRQELERQARATVRAGAVSHRAKLTQGK